jgi:ParB-like partition proteins
MSDNKRKPPFHHKVEPGSASADRKPFHHDVKPNSSFEENDSPPTLKSLLPPELAALLPEGHSAGDYVLSPAEILTLKRMKEGTFEPDITSTPPSKFSPKIATLPPRSPLPPARTIPGVEARIRTNTPPIRAVRDRVSKRRSRLKRMVDVLKHGPQGETISKIVTNKVVMIDLDKIVTDRNFKNCRADIDPEELMLLIESIRHEGIKVPISLIVIPGEDDLYYIRSGFRRIESVRHLKWRQIPAIVLPVDLPEEDEYWINIIENTARQNLHSYEIAKAAQTMRDRFQTNYKEFALKAGYSDKYIDNLLRAIDRLPDAILERWKEKSKIPVDYYYVWASMLPHEAINSFNIFAGQHPHIERIQENTSPPTEREPRDKHSRLMVASAYGWKRMGYARQAITATHKLDEPTKELCLKVVDFCMGNREDIPNVYDHLIKMKEIRRKRREKPDPDEE